MYDSIRDTLDTGDIVLYSGSGPISTAIKIGTCSEWSHVGVVVRLKDFDMVCILQSTTLSKAKDVLSDRPVEGVQLNLLSESLSTYPGKVAVRKLNVLRTKGMLEAVRNFRKEVHGRPYEEKKIQLLKSAWDFFGGANEEDLSSLFCSELVAELYQRMDLIEDDKPSNEYTPKDFANTLNLNHGATFSDIIYLKK